MLRTFCDDDLCHCKKDSGLQLEDCPTPSSGSFTISAPFVAKLGAFRFLIVIESTNEARAAPKMEFSKFSKDGIFQNFPKMEFSKIFQRWNFPKFSKDGIFKKFSNMEFSKFFQTWNFPNFFKHGIFSKDGIFQIFQKMEFSNLEEKKFLKNQGSMNVPNDHYFRRFGSIFGEKYWRFS
jgi:hypothetical protein